jgi:hypothetical protein
MSNINYDAIHEELEKTRDRVLKEIGIIKNGTYYFHFHLECLYDLNYDELLSLHKNDFQFFECDGVNHFDDYLSLLMTIKELQNEK